MVYHLHYFFCELFLFTRVLSRFFFYFALIKAILRLAKNKILNSNKLLQLIIIKKLLFDGRSQHLKISIKYLIISLTQNRCSEDLSSKINFRLNGGCAYSLITHNLFNK